jgi:hypothetical protein
LCSTKATENDTEAEKYVNFDSLKWNVIGNLVFLWVLLLVSWRFGFYYHSVWDI